MNRTFLLWKEADISNVGGQLTFSDIDYRRNPAVA